MKNLSVIILVLIIAVVLTLMLVSFQVRETEKVLLTRFGNPVKTIEEPGFHWKWPVPIERVNRFDIRYNINEGVLTETTTKGGDPINVSTYIVWRIDNPRTFLEQAGTKEAAKKQLYNLLGDTQNSVIGQYNFSDFVNADKSKVKIDEIETKMLGIISKKAKESYGIEVVMAGIDQLGISQEVTKNVFERMKANRNSITEATISEGKAEATKIREDADNKVSELMAVAQAQAKAIRGSGDAEAAKYYKMLSEDPEFAMFLREIDALKNILKERSTVVLDADTQPMNLLKGLPDIQSK